METPGPLGNRFERGDRVRLLNGFGDIGRIVEVRGPLGPDGAQLYTIAAGTNRPRLRVVVLERQLEPAPKRRKKKATAPTEPVSEAEGS